MMLLLFAVGMTAGFIDAIAGGGGLLTVPALMLAKLPPHQVLGTNKGQSVFGSGMALHRFFSSPLLDRRRALISFVPALAGSALGVLLLLTVPNEALKPVVIVLLALAAVAVLIQKPPAAHLEPRRRSQWLAVAVAFLIAGYDGFFGPGTGTFLILAYAWLWRDPLDRASANAKAVNFASNLAAVICFSSLGWVVWKLALPMAAGQLIGGYAGAHLTIRAGRPLVRFAVVAVTFALLIRLGWGLF